MYVNVRMYLIPDGLLRELETTSQQGHQYFAPWSLAFLFAVMPAPPHAGVWERCAGSSLA